MSSFKSTLVCPSNNNITTAEPDFDVKQPFLHPTFRHNDDHHNIHHELENRLDQTDHQAHDGNHVDHLKMHKDYLRISQDDLKNHQNKNPDHLKNHWHSVASLVVFDPAFNSFVSQVSHCTTFSQMYLDFPDVSFFDILPHLISEEAAIHGGPHPHVSSFQ